ncbi:MAG: hypothetical protein ACI4XJ_09640 [Eubacteriales bacterium]
MACFVVPAVEAIATTVAGKVLKSKEMKPVLSDAADAEVKIPFSRKLKWLSNLLWGGSALLAFEHLWHGEIVPFFPFLTAMSDPAETAAMLEEMASVGTSMAALITVIWVGMVLVSDRIVKRPATKAESIPEV